MPIPVTIHDHLIAAKLELLESLRLQPICVIIGAQERLSTWSTLYCGRLQQGLYGGNPDSRRRNKRSDWFRLLDSGRLEFPSGNLLDWGVVRDQPAGAWGTALPTVGVYRCEHFIRIRRNFEIVDLLTYQPPVY